MKDIYIKQLNALFPKAIEILKKEDDYHSDQLRGMLNSSYGNEKPKTFIKVLDILAVNWMWSQDTEKAELSAKVLDITRNDKKWTTLDELLLTNKSVLKEIGIEAAAGIRAHKIRDVRAGRATFNKEELDSIIEVLKGLSFK